MAGRVNLLSALVVALALVSVHVSASFLPPMPLRPLVMPKPLFPVPRVFGMVPFRGFNTMAMAPKPRPSSRFLPLDDLSVRGPITLAGGIFVDADGSRTIMNKGPNIQGANLAFHQATGGRSVNFATPVKLTVVAAPLQPAVEQKAPAVASLGAPITTAGQVRTSLDGDFSDSKIYIRAASGSAGDAFKDSLRTTLARTMADVRGDFSDSVLYIDASPPAEASLGAPITTSQLGQANQVRTNLNGDISDSKIYIKAAPASAGDASKGSPRTTLGRTMAGVRGDFSDSVLYIDAPPPAEASLGARITTSQSGQASQVRTNLNGDFSDSNIYIRGAPGSAVDASKGSPRTTLARTMADVRGDFSDSVLHIDASPPAEASLGAPITTSQSGQASQVRTNLDGDISDSKIFIRTAPASAGDASKGSPRTTLGRTLADVRGDFSDSVLYIDASPPGIEHMKILS